MRPWGFGGLALEKLNNPITSVERIPNTITDDAAVVAWMETFVAAVATDEAAVSCTHHRWTKDGGGAFEVAPANANADAVVIWQVEEWVLGANSATKLPADPSKAASHKTAVSHQNPTPIKLKKAIECTEGAGTKTTDWCRSYRPGLPWFAAAEATGVASTPAGPSSTVVMPPGRYGSLGAFAAHTEAAKMESTAMITKQSGQISKLDEIMHREINEDDNRHEGAANANAGSVKSFVRVC